MNNFSKPHEVSDVFQAFPARVSHLMPEYASIPRDFKGRRMWVDWQQKWFYSGLTEMPVPKAGIDLKQAMRHLATIQGSFEPKHEHKEAAVAYLASLWFDAPGATSPLSPEPT